MIQIHFQNTLYHDPERTVQLLLLYGSFQGSCACDILAITFSLLLYSKIVEYLPDVSRITPHLNTYIHSRAVPDLAWFKRRCLYQAP